MKVNYSVFESVFFQNHHHNLGIYFLGHFRHNWNKRCTRNYKSWPLHYLEEEPHHIFRNLILIQAYLNFVYLYEESQKYVHPTNHFLAAKIPDASLRVSFLLSLVHVLSQCCLWRNQPPHGATSVHQNTNRAHHQQLL